MIRRFIFCIFFVGVSALNVRALEPRANAKQIQTWILQSVKEMPVGGEHNLGEISGQKLAESFEWKGNQLRLNAEKAKPNYCTIATYLVFYKTLEKYWAWAKSDPNLSVSKAIKPQLEKDGERIWGRWNSNGPGTAKFVYDSKLGKSFESLALAKPGDFLKWWRTPDVGKLEKGHSVVYLGQAKVDGKPGIRYWSSNTGKGYSYGEIQVSKLKRLLFTRIESIENYHYLSQMTDKDEFLSSMLTQESTWEEVRKVVGLQ